MPLVFSSFILLMDRTSLIVCYCFILIRRQE